MNFQLSPELKSTMDELAIDWMRLRFTEIYQCLVEEMKYNDEYNAEHADEEVDAFLNTFLKSELFYQRDDLSFGKYLKESGRINAEDTIQLMQYCKEYYCNYCNTLQGILDFTKMHDLEYLGTQFGYIYADVEINVLKEFNSIKNAPLLK